MKDELTVTREHSYLSVFFITTKETEITTFS